MTRMHSHVGHAGEAGQAGSMNLAHTIAIVDDSMLARSMLAKYLSGLPNLRSAVCFGSSAELLGHAFAHNPDYLVVSLRKMTISDEDLFAAFASKFPDCRAVIAVHPENNSLKLRQIFPQKCQVFDCKPESRASEVAQQTLEQIRRFLQIVPSPNIQTQPSALPDLKKFLSTVATTEAVQSSSRADDGAYSASPQSPSIPLAMSNGATKLLRKTSSGLPTRLIIIGGSTGAPAAVTKLLQQLPADFPLPIAVSLHMLEDFTGRLAQSLDRSIKLRCVEASDNELMQPATVYIARGDHHLTIEKNNQGRFVSRLNREPPEHFARPSVNQLFRSAAIAAGPATVAVMLTGIGSDGLEGTEVLVRRGGLVIAQDEASSTVWGMPAAVIHAGLAREVMPPGEAGRYIAMKIAVEAKRQQT